MAFHACDECGAVYLGIEEHGGSDAVCRNCRGKVRAATAAEAVAHLRRERRPLRAPPVTREWVDAELDAEADAEEELAGRPNDHSDRQ